MTSRPVRLPRPEGRRGMTVVIALGFLVVAAILGFALHTLTRSQRGMADHAYAGECLHQAANSACAAAAQHYLARMNDPADELSNLLRDPDASGKLPPFTPDLHKGLSATLADFPGLTVKLAARLTDLVPLPPPALDPRERRGAFLFEVEARWRGVSRSVTMKRAFHVAQAVPPLVSRFTLFLTGCASDNFNNLSGSADGTTGADRPLALVNGDGSSPTSNGWIHLGGGRVGLNLGRGLTNFGEDFMLPPAVTRSPFFPNQDYALLHMNLGFSAEVARDPVYARFPVKDAFKSSCLRLFGCTAAGEDASPALVVGDVWRRYVQAAAVSPVRDGTLGPVIPMPWLLDRDGVPSDPGFPPFLFLSQKLYQVYMSQVREEPFNRSFDYLLSCGKQPTPLYCKNIYKTLFPEVYPLLKPRFELSTASGAPHYRGRIEDLNLAKELSARRVGTFAGVDELLASAGDDGEGGATLSLHGVRFVAGKGRADLSGRGPLRYRGCATLVFAGDVTLPALEPVDPKRDFLAVVSLEGNLTLKGAVTFAGIVAPEGEISFPAGARITGFLAARRIDPQILKRGGLLVYDMRANPEGKEFDRFLAANDGGGALFYHER